VRLLRAKGLDEHDKVMRQTVAFRVVQALSIAAKRGTIGSEGKRKGVRILGMLSTTKLTDGIALPVPLVPTNTVGFRFFLL
jgi:hypothetical protein